MSTPASTAFNDFVAIVERLRRECPWDREQTNDSLRPHLLEEAYEAAESIQHADDEGLKGELGDILLHIVLHSIIASERKGFTLDDVITGISDKMVRRHPHIFGSTEVSGSAEVLRNWEQIKLTEGRVSVLDGVPKGMSALLRAARVQGKAAKVGFDWAAKADVWKKVEEELAEFRHAEQEGIPERIEDEFGDLLFSLVNYSRFIDVDAEGALGRTVRKFERRFRFIEDRVRETGRVMGEVPLEELDKFWEESKTAMP